MVKIERITVGAIATIERNGIRQKIFLNQLITPQELESMEVENGTVTYSIDEEIIKEKSSDTKPVVVNVQSDVVVTDQVVAETTTEVKQPEQKPVIIKPATRTVSKK